MKRLVTTIALAIASIAVSAQSPTRQTEAALTYLGAFLPPAEGLNGFDLGYGGRPIAFNPARGSLFMGNDLTNRVAEFSIPGLADPRTGAALPRARYLQSVIADPTEGRMGELTTSSVALYGFLVDGDRLYLSAARYYDAQNDQRVGHGARSVDLTQPSFSGWSAVQFPIDGVMRPDRQGFVAGWMAWVPPVWRERLGCPAITGNGTLPIISRTSFGAAAFCFDPRQIGQPIVPATALVYYPPDHPTLGNWLNQGPPSLFNQATQIGGVVIIGDHAYFFVRNGIGPQCYGYGVTNPALHGIPAADGVMQCFDLRVGAKGSHSYPYRYEVWAYALEDFAAVKAGTRAPWDLRPDVWPLDFLDGERGAGIGGAAYDPATNTIYVSQLDAVPVSRMPIIHAMRITPVIAPDPRLTQLESNMTTLRQQIDALTARLEQLLTALKAALSK